MNTLNTIKRYLVTGGDGNTRKQLQRALGKKGMECIPSRDPPGFTVDVSAGEDEFFRGQVDKLRGESGEFSADAVRREFLWKGRLTFQEVSQSNVVVTSLLFGQGDSALMPLGGKVVFSLGGYTPPIQEEVHPSLHEDGVAVELGKGLTRDQLVKAARRKGVLNILALCTFQELIEAFKQKKGKKRLLDGHSRTKLIAVARAKGGDQAFLNQLELSRLLETVLWRGGREFLLDQIPVEDIVLAVENVVQHLKDQSTQIEQAPYQGVAVVSVHAPSSPARQQTRTMSRDVLLGAGEEFEPGDELTPEELVGVVRRRETLGFFVRITFQELADALRQRIDKDRVFDEFTPDELIEVIRDRRGEQEFLDQFDLPELIRAFLDRGGKDYFVGQLRPGELVEVVEYKVRQLRQEKEQFQKQKEEAQLSALERIEARCARKGLQLEEGELLQDIRNIQ